MELQFLNAREGDAIWVRWGRGHQLLIDLGTEATGRAFADRMRALPVARRAFDLLVVTHVDTDHIGGVLSGIVDQQASIPGWTFADVWFNGWEHLHDRVPSRQPSTLEPMGGNHGETFAKWLRAQPWNEAFDRRPAVRTDAALPRIDLPGGLSIVLLAPVMQRLTDEIPKWKAEVDRAMARGELGEVSPGLERLGGTAPPVLKTVGDLQAQAARVSPPDDSKSNATSLVLLLEWQGRRVLLTGDSTTSEVVNGLAKLDEDGRVPLDVIKAPHHGSRRNLLRPLVEAVSCGQWVFSTDGTQHHHPDAEAVARVVGCGQPNPTLHFTTRSTFNGWWDNPEWQHMFGYSATYGTVEDGITITLRARDSGSKEP